MNSTIFNGMGIVVKDIKKADGFSIVGYHFRSIANGEMKIDIKDGCKVYKLTGKTWKKVGEHDTIKKALVQVLMEI